LQSSAALSRVFQLRGVAQRRKKKKPEKKKRALAKKLNAEGEACRVRISNETPDPSCSFIFVKGVILAGFYQ